MNGDAPEVSRRLRSLPWGGVVAVLFLGLPALLLTLTFRPLVAIIQSSPFLRENWGNVASVAGLGLAWVGFVWTISLALRSKRAAIAAELAASEARDALLRFDVIVELTKAIAVLEDIFQRHLESDWASLPVRYALIRSHLVAIKSSSHLQCDEHRDRLAGVLQQLRTIDEKVCTFLISKKLGAPPRPSLLLDVIRQQTDHLAEILAELRQRPGVRNVSR